MGEWQAQLQALNVTEAPPQTLARMGLLIGLYDACCYQQGCCMLGQRFQRNACGWFGQWGGIVGLRYVLEAALSQVYAGAEVVECMPCAVMLPQVHTGDPYL